MRIVIEKGSPEPLGARVYGERVNFAFISPQTDCGVILYDNETEYLRIPFPADSSLGNIHYMSVKGIETGHITYSFYEKDKVCSDPYAVCYQSSDSYGQSKGRKYAVLGTGEFDWGEDHNPGIPYEDVVCYCLHVRGFTKHSSSKVKGKGTFQGLAEKIPYLKDLGVTTVELQPAYEFEEISAVNYAGGDLRFLNPVIDSRNTGLNYWGYVGGCYYSPKRTYAYSQEPVTEFKDMIRRFHQSGMEVVMQFYFEEEMPEREISNILRFWVHEYHIDGFHLKGGRIPITLITEDAAFASTKLWYYEFEEKKSGPVRTKAIYKDDFLYDMRRFLKGDEGMLQAVMHHMRTNPAAAGRINYFTNYEGFTLMDMVSYEQKHNEENGEDNKDGNDHNSTWNCGAEGKTRKKSIVELRVQQIKNALCLLFLSQGTPLLFMGDEFGNSQNGNNNPYCQDNEITWLNWKDLERNNTIFEFTRELIRFRMSNPILHKREEMRVMDYLSCGYPDLSYHGEVPWKPCLYSTGRQLGMMYCGKYADNDRKHTEEFFYIAINMHWDKHSYALPKLPKGMKWTLHMHTAKPAVVKEAADGKETDIEVPARCIYVFIGK